MDVPHPDVTRGIPGRPLIEHIARVCHDANGSYCRTLGDESQVLWGLAPEWQRQSAIDGVEGILSGRVTSPEESHRNWCREKWRNGWVYAPTKDPEKKFHPCLVPYEDLPPEQRAKDALFFAIVRALAGPIVVGLHPGGPPEPASGVAEASGDAIGPEV